MSPSRSTSRFEDRVQCWSADLSGAGDVALAGSGAVGGACEAFDGGHGIRGFLPGVRSPLALEGELDKSGLGLHADSVKHLTTSGKGRKVLCMEIKEARRIAKAHNNLSAIVEGFGWVNLTGADVLALNSSLPAMRRLGTDDSYNCCDLCGKTNLKHTVVFSPRDGGEDVHYGTDCAAAYEFARQHGAA